MRLIIWLTCLFPFLSLAQEPFNPRFSINNEEKLMATVGGLNNPQFIELDLNNDSLQDIAIFDKSANIYIPFERQADSTLKLNWAYQKHFPSNQHWAVGHDYNQDGAQDLFVYSIVPGIAGITVYKGYYEADTLKYEQAKDYLTFPLNNGIQTNLFVTNIDIPAISDIDGDGDVDIASFNVNGGKIEYFKNQSNESGYDGDSLLFFRETSCFGGIFESGISNEVDLVASPGSCASSAQEPQVFPRHAGSTLLLFDPDNDGDKDLLLGDVSFSQLNYLKNGGTNTEAWFESQDPNFPSYDTPTDVAFFPAAFTVDIDLDGKQEVIVSPNAKGSGDDVSVAWVYEQTNGDSFQLKTKNYLVDDMVDLGTGSIPVLEDIDGDGNLDLIVGTEGTFKKGSGQRNASLYYFNNIGTNSQPFYELIDTNFLSISELAVAPFALSPAFGDLDGDGDRDILIGTGNGDLLFFEKDNDTYLTPDLNYNSIDIGTYSSPSIGDINADGQPDLLIGERNGNINLFLGSADGFSSEPDDAFWQSIDTRSSSEITGYSQPHLVNTTDGLYLLVGSNSRSILDYGFVDDLRAEPLPFLDVNVGDRSRITSSYIDNTLYTMLGNARGGINGFKFESFLASTSTSTLINAEIDVFPNPNTGVFQVETAFPIKQIEVYNTQGQLLIQGTNPKLQLPKAGVYWVKVLGNNQELGLKKVVVLK